MLIFVFPDLLIFYEGNNYLIKLIFLLNLILKF
jgi:hypothetical protein